MSLVRHDFQAAARLRLQIERYDEQSGAEWHRLLEDSAALTTALARWARGRA